MAQALLQQGNLEGQVGPYIPIVYRQHPEISIAPVSVIHCDTRCVNTGQRWV